MKKQKDKMHNALLPLVLEYNSMWSKIVDNLDKERETEEDVNNLMDWCVNLLRFREAHSHRICAAHEGCPFMCALNNSMNGGCQAWHDMDAIIEEVSMMLENAGF